MESAINGLRPVISIHAAREGGDFTVAVNYIFRWIFQSTPPVKAATQILFRMCYHLYISIHAAREGGDYSVIIIHI